ncbi:PTS lactose/cellobiose transporter subunit IIA [Fonticella tunisiensis]|uniref:PTS system lichenan oligosaccharide-specific IIA component (Lac family) n=1 Tax=Fonticella tunisiensis TaxID=1096341 RepID=A0A4V3ES23_9CLOT|nr:PTS lactose/cellobiose transporter subunit IIA [Fonticella tunisiensis]TDT51900.1 PTS system lichenan oligosaccharide-specific IIA component (Lac family) [Fonticella tunisiensis]
MEYQEIVMTIILSGGNARSFAMEAISLAKKGDIKGAREALAKAEEELGAAHRIQTELIQNEAAGNRTEVGLLMVHAQDHLMNAITVKDLANEIIDVYEKLYA